MDLDKRIININEYQLTVSPDAYLAAIGAVARRTEADGHRGVLAYQFYVNRNEDTAGAMITYADADAWVAHHELAYRWDEMPVLQGTVSLRRLTVFGPLNEAMERWIRDAGLSYTHYDTFADGFVRDRAD